MSTLLCSMCKEAKAPTEFNRRRERGRGVNYVCRACSSARRFTAKYLGNQRAGHLRRKFGITSSAYAQLLAAQNGGCAICEQPCETGKRLAVDHDHRTGQVRGLLCSRCNTALGLLRDDWAIVGLAAEYLEFHRTRPKWDPRSQH